MIITVPLLEQSLLVKSSALKEERFGFITILNLNSQLIKKLSRSTRSQSQ